MLTGLICVRTYLSALVPEREGELVLRVERTPEANWELAYVDVFLSQAHGPCATEIRTDNGKLLWRRT